MPKPSNLSIPSSLVMDKKKPIKNTGIALLIAQFLLINFIIINKLLYFDLFFISLTHNTKNKLQITVISNDCLKSP